MTEKERFDLCMSTKLGDILSEEFKTYLLANGFFSAPASTKYHGAYEGGLFDHSFAVMNFLVELSAKNGLKWQRVRLSWECSTTFVKSTVIVTPL